jgi:hypothetical protein
MKNGITKWIPLAIIVGAGLVGWGALNRDVSHNSEAVKECTKENKRLNEKINQINNNIIAICVKLNIECEL